MFELNCKRGMRPACDLETVRSHRRMAKPSRSSSKRRHSIALLCALALQTGDAARRVSRSVGALFSCGASPGLKSQERT